jgi:phosphatidylserine/phosphatidylglycerophosphate/cardiolipin synthase-like enzyme
MEIYEYHRSLMHAKVAVIDEHWATVAILRNLILGPDV